MSDEREWIEKTAEEVWAIVGDGFQPIQAAPGLLSLIGTRVGEFGDLTLEERRAKVAAVAEYVLAESDGPGPDSLLDPLLLMAAKAWLIPAVIV